MDKRKGLSKKVRFEVFKRDSFTCQYCGQMAPSVTLHADHIIPVSEGGEDDPTNLVTSCRDCNLGKSNRLLSDDAVIIQRKHQLDILQERREQLEMMMEWQQSLVDLEQQATDALAQLWHKLVPGYNLNDHGLRNLKKWLDRYEIQEVAECMRISARQYLVFEDDSIAPTSESVEKTFSYVLRIARSRRKMAERPYLKDLYYIRGILRNRLHYCNEWQCIQLMETAIKAGIDTNTIQEFAKTVSNWTKFREQMETWTENTKGVG